MVPVGKETVSAVLLPGSPVTWSAFPDIPAGAAVTAVFSGQSVPVWPTVS